jgi:leucyl/phenylalanyl-tRNA--protein transferase
MTSGRVAWIAATDPPDGFPPVTQALREPDGLLAAGGDLGTPRLLAAYRRGIFPWYEEGQPLLWWSPDPRCVFRAGDLHVSRRLRQAIRRSTLEVRINTAFADVIRACAGPRRYQRGTWITRDIRNAFERLHAEGWAHSIEIWSGDELTGGLYGLAIGRAFFGESMFSAQTNASKFALLYMDRLLRDDTFGLLDCQVRSPHLLTMGAETLPRSKFVALLDDLCEPGRAFDKWPGGPVGVSALMPD